MRVIIYKPTRSVMQYGDEGSADWVLEEYPRGNKSIDKLTGWISSADTNAQVKIKFQTKEEATRFAQKNQMEFEVIEPNKPIMKPNIYANNFK